MTDTEAAALELIVDILAAGQAQEDGTPSDEAWADAQVVLDWLGEQEAQQQAAMSLPLDPEEKPRRERTSAGPLEHGTGTSVMTTPGDFTPEPPPTRHKKPVKKTVKTSKSKRRLGKRLRVRKKWTDE